MIISKDIHKKDKNKDKDKKYMFYLKKIKIYDF